MSTNGTAVAALRLTHEAWVSGQATDLRLVDELLDQTTAELPRTATTLARMAASLGILLEETLDEFSFDRWLTDLAFQDIAAGNGVNVTDPGIEGGEGSCSLPEDPSAPPCEAS